MAGYPISLPPSRFPSSQQLSQRTNTIAVTSIPRSFFHPHILDVLRNHLAMYGEINRWVPLPGFGRVIVVYELEDDAESAKMHCDPVILEGNDGSEAILRVYRADPNPLMSHGNSSVPEANYLRPPAIEKNFLISPPGSPPIGWEPVQEDPPNSSPLADDLMEALRKLQLQEKRSGLELLLDPGEGSGVGVYVEDCDDYEEQELEEDWVYGKSAPAREKWRPVPTALPSMRPIIA